MDSKTGNWFELTVPSECRFMVLVRRVVSQFARQAGFSDLDANQIVIAVDEACTNIIRHCYKGCNRKRIFLKCQVRKGGLEVRIRDYGPKADLKRIRTPETAGLLPGGLGLRMMRKAMDRVVFEERNKVGLEVSMYKRFASDRLHAAGQSQGPGS